MINPDHLRDAPNDDGIISLVNDQAAHQAQTALPSPFSRIFVNRETAMLSNQALSRRKYTYRLTSLLSIWHREFVQLKGVSSFSVSSFFVLISPPQLGHGSSRLFSLEGETESKSRDDVSPNLSGELRRGSL